MVGTAEYQVTWQSLTVRQKESWIETGGHHDGALPEAKVEIVEATRP